MSYHFNRIWLSTKFGEIQRRTLNVLEQLDDEQVNWRPNEASHSIAALIKHMEGNMNERVINGILGGKTVRDREQELRPSHTTKYELHSIVNDKLQLVIDTVNRISDAELEATQTVRNKERTNLDMLHQCAAHYSEHMGQIFYVAKQLLGDRYVSTSI
ncbi:DinB family protein [Paenibacillus arenilitoris]|uniref:DUF1572 family protein n=1 Tax=Paenibacillus arenilitoris TaxID=2772299 RepID=A0A927CNC9_9BACL|nr:DinB family protein [Paenibacillus arenilitoris]MBD2871184.1 DUF1572 family protein [Paenibacillus arenilitoris]